MFEGSSRSSAFSAPWSPDYQSSPEAALSDAERLAKRSVLAITQRASNDCRARLDVHEQKVHQQPASC